MVGRAPLLCSVGAPLLGLLVVSSLVTGAAADELFFSPGNLASFKKSVLGGRKENYFPSADAQLSMRVLDPVKTKAAGGVPKSKYVKQDGGVSFDLQERRAQTWLVAMEYSMGLRLNEYNFLQYLKTNPQYLTKFPKSHDSDYKKLQGVLDKQVRDYEYGDSDMATYRTRTGYSDDDLLGKNGKEPRLVEAMGPPAVIYHYSPNCDEMIDSNEVRHGYRTVWGTGRKGQWGCNGETGEGNLSDRPERKVLRFPTAWRDGVRRGVI